MASVINLKQVWAWGVGRDETAASPSQDHLLVSGDFTLDLRSRRVTVRNEEIRLDEDEFEMLVFLIRHRTNIITPRTRLTTRWSRTQSRQSDFLHTLAKLQHKLEAIPGCARYIRTEPWVVCRFDSGKEE